MGELSIMKLEEWEADEIKRVQLFVKWWKNNAAANPDAPEWPMAMPPGEWDDQFHCWGE